MSGINQEINALVQADADGVITPEESARLQELIESSEEVRAFHADCLQLVQALDGLEQIEPPRGLDESVLGLVGDSARRSEVPEEAPAGGWRDLLALWFNYPVLRYATAFVLGALLTSTLSSPVGELDGGAMRTASVVGTMTSAPEFALMGTQRVEHGGTGLRFDLLRADQLVQLRFAVSSQDPVELRVRFLAGSYQLFGFSQQSGSLAGLSADEGEVTLRAKGDQGFAVFFAQIDGGAREFEVELSRDGETLDILRMSPRRGE